MKFIVICLSYFFLVFFCLCVRTSPRRAWTSYLVLSVVQPSINHRYIVYLLNWYVYLRAQNVQLVYTAAGRVTVLLCYINPNRILQYDINILVVQTW
jgi:hypothetical protein